MKETLLLATPLFHGMSLEAARALVQRLEHHVRHYDKGQVICRAGEPSDSLGIVLYGSAAIEHNDLWGARSLLGHVAPGDLFAEVYACLPGQPLRVDVVACEPCEVLFLDIKRLLETSGEMDAAQAQFLTALLKLMARKSLALSDRILHTAPKTIRGRVLSYLSQLSREAGSQSFTIPFDRQQLADHLGVDRSALSHTLSKLQAEGILSFRKRHFVLHHDV